MPGIVSGQSVIQDSRSSENIPHPKDSSANNNAEVNGTFHEDSALDSECMTGIPNSSIVNGSLENGDHSLEENGLDESTSCENSDDDKPNGDTINKANDEDEKTSNEKPSSSEKKEELEEVPMKQIEVKVQIPGGTEPITIPLTNHDTIQDVRQVVLEQFDCCYRTCFSVQLNGKRLDDFTELHDVAGLKPDSVLTIVDEPYSAREVRIHVRRLRDLIMINSMEPNAFTATDNMSLSYCQTITEVDVEEEAAQTSKYAHRSSDDISPPDYAVLDKDGAPLLKPLHLEERSIAMPPCLKDMSYSGWNPPPGNRKLSGDLLYLIVCTLEGNTHHVTASSNGFYVNKSTRDEFNPLAIASPERAQTLVSLLNQLSPLFKRNFNSMQRMYDTSCPGSHYAKNLKKHPLELVASPLQVFPWISPAFEHTVDPFRAEDSVTNRIGYEEQIPGQLRDWNEELQSAKELPKKTLHQRILRDRALYKITCDFIAAATRGTIAVVDGNVMAINPGDDEKMRMYIWNNIFFSFACDSREHYEKYGGDEAAYAAASLDLKGVEVYNKLDIDGLHTLGTVVVDYRGYRIVAQSIIPGILQREQENSVVYGSVDGGKTISGQDKFLSMLNQAGLQLKIRPHTVINEKDERVDLCSSIECKGIVGADGRHYILDLFRSFPPDVNFLDVPKAERSLIDGSPVEKKETEVDERFPLPHAHQLVSLRPILVEAFHTFKYLTFVNIVTISYREMKAKAEADRKRLLAEEETNKKALAEQQIDATDNEKKESSDEDELIDGKPAKDVTLEELTKLSDKIENQQITQNIKTATMAIGSLSETEFDIRFNPDAHIKDIKLADSEAAQDKLDKALIEDAAVFLADTMVPKFVEDLQNLVITPIDGISLTEAMHNRGINMRYLGLMASLCNHQRRLDHIFKIVVKEIVVRSAKRHLKMALQTCNQRCLTICVAHFLNCFLSSNMSDMKVQLPADEFVPKKKSKKKKTPKMPHHLPTSGAAWTSMTPASLWADMKTHVHAHFGYDLETCGIDEFISTHRVHKVSLLRELCRKTGVQILAREYVFDDTKLPTFSPDDILNLFPVVKCRTPRAVDANAIFEAAQTRLNTGFPGSIGEAHELLIEALNMYNQVYGPLHPEIVTCYRAVAKIHYIADDSPQAVAYQKKAVIIAERVYGVEHPETIEAYRHLALYCYHARLVPPALRLMYRARYLALLCYGEGHPEMATFDTNIGLMLHSHREFTSANEFLQRAVHLQMKYYGKESLQTATGHHLVARTLSAIGEYKTALNYEKITNSIYQKHFGKDDVRTKESSEALKAILNQAVLLQKTLKDIKEKGIVFPSKTATPKLNDDDRDILNMVNKIKDQDVSMSDDAAKAGLHDTMTSLHENMTSENLTAMMNAAKKIVNKIKPACASSPASASSPAAAKKADTRIEEVE